MSAATDVIFPGGPYASDFGFDLSKWLSKELIDAAERAGDTGGPVSAQPMNTMMSMMGVLSVVSTVQTIASIVVDIVPPKIPPPFWILWALPCVPMLTGPNCLFSVLYPVSLPDFIMASTTDGIMDGLITEFPAKYAQRVGKTNDSDYRLCAMSYLGMHCASIFPMCWLPMGVRQAMSFPMCFVHCILTLVACPGFWIDDIIGPCMSISAPPLCSFALFTNLAKVPPQ